MAMTGNLEALLLISIGAGLLSFPVPLVTITLWPLGLVLIVLGARTYRRLVHSAFQDWESRKIPLIDLARIMGQSYNDSTSPSKTIYP